MLVVSVLVMAFALFGPGGGLVPASPPAFAADLFAELRNFPGVVLVPTPTLAPFDGLEPWRVELNRPRAGSTGPLRGRYLIQYRDQRVDESGTHLDGSAQIGGTLGRDEFDQTVTTLAMRSFKRCAGDAPYCAENVGGRDDTPAASELFRGLLVGEHSALAEHVVCCGGHYWSLSWFDEARAMSYTLVLVGPLAEAYATTITPDNDVHARAIAEIATQLVPLE
jgi:hypothetical protein